MIQRMSAIRKARGLTQDELSRISGVPRITIARYETGRVDPTMANAKKLADALGVKIDDLIEKGA